MEQDSHNAHKKFLEAFFKSESIDEAIKKSGLSKAKAQYYLRKYKNTYVAIFEKLGMPRDEVFKKHIGLIDKPISRSHTFAGITTTHYDNKTHLKAIELYYKLTAMLEENKIIINNTSDEDKMKELKVAEAIDKDPVLREKFMNIIETHDKGE